MLFRRAILDRIAAGDVTLAFRRWKRPTVNPGTMLRTAVGVVAIDGVEQIEDASLTDDQAIRAGSATRAELLDDLSGGADRALYRISLRFAGEDSRASLRDLLPNAQDLERIGKRLARMDVTGDAPWTLRTLELIATRPEVAAAQLAATLGRDKLAFKADVRKLKELGLTESLDRGYRLSKRGQAILDALRDRPSRSAP